MDEASKSTLMDPQNLWKLRQTGAVAVQRVGPEPMTAGSGVLYVSHSGAVDLSRQSRDDSLPLSVDSQRRTKQHSRHLVPAEHRLTAPTSPISRELVVNYRAWNE